VNQTSIILGDNQTYKPREMTLGLAALSLVTYSNSSCQYYVSFF